ncbi:MAG: hypothetical protein AAF968_11455 [Pseudomonadota bacterium]
MLPLLLARPRLATGLLIAGLVLLAAALVYIMPKVVSQAIAIDFRFIWLAGSLWIDGLDPYSAVYADEAAQRLRPGNMPEFLLYPPGWWGIAVVFAGFDEATASLLWRISSVLAAVLGAGTLLWAVWRAIAPHGGARHALLALGAIALALTFGSVAAANNVTIAQTSMLMLLGGGLAGAGVISASRGLLVMGLLILSLKPSIGFALVPCILLLRTPLLSTVALGGLVLLISAPPLLTFGPVETVRGFVESASRYGALDINAGPALTGLRHLGWRLTGEAPSATLLLALSGLFSAGGMLMARNLVRDVEGRALAFAFAISCLLCAAPLHSYDFVFLLPLMLLVPLLRPLDAMAIFGAALFTMRSSNIAPLLGLVPSGSVLPGTTVATLAGTALFLWFGGRLALAAIRARQRA